MAKTEKKKKAVAPKAPPEKPKKKSGGKSVKESASSDEHAFTIKTSDSGQMRVSISEFRGEMRLDFRHYYKDRESGEWRPTGKGTSVPASKSVKVMRRLKKLIAAAESDGIEVTEE